MTEAVTQVLIGIFIGGQGRRMGGRDKSQLLAPDGRHTLLQRWQQVIEQAGLDEVVLVGEPPRAAGRPEAGLEHVQDLPAAIGPLGGLSGLLQRAGEGHVVTLACDMPYVQPALLRRLATEQPEAAALAPRAPDGGKWQAMLARYDVGRARPQVVKLIEDGERSLQRVLQTLDARELSLGSAELPQLRDWDRPEDMER